MSTENEKSEYFLQKEGQQIVVDSQAKKMNLSSNVDIPISIDDEQLYILPQHKSIKTKEIYSSSRNKEDQITPEIQKLVEDIDSTLDKNLFIWEDSSSWKFKLPITIFTGNEVPINFIQPNEQFGTHSLSKLSLEQLETIKQKGEFIIKHSPEDEGTTWKMNPLIVKGSENIHNTFLRNLSFSWHQLMQIPCRLGGKYSNNYSILQKIFTPNLQSGVSSILSIISNIANLTFGVKKVQMFNDQEIIEELFRERNKETLLKYYEDLSCSFYEFIYYLDENLHINEQNKDKIQQQKDARQQFQNLHQEFEKRAETLEKEKLKELQNFDVDEDKALFEILEAKQKLLFMTIEELQQPADPQQRKHLIDLITASQITVLQYEKLQTKLKIKSQEVVSQIKQKYPIKSLVSMWREMKHDELMKPITRELIIETNTKITDELSQKGLKPLQILFERFAEFQLNGEQIFNSNYARIQKKSTTPCRIFETTQKLFGKLEVKKIINNGITRFEEVSTKTYQTPTSFFGWRFVLQLVRWKVWTVNAIHSLLHNLASGQFGLKALFYTKPFYNSYVNFNSIILDQQIAYQYIDSTNGQKIPCGKINPYSQVLKNVFAGIENCRREFELRPDRGIFGKNFSRFFNYIECYFFRGLIAGIGGVGIGMPLMIVSNCVISSVLSITSIIWIPTVIILRWGYHILIWDFDSPSRKGWFNYDPIYSKYQTVQSFPLVRLIAKLILGSFEIVNSVASATIIHPGLSIFGIILAYGRKFLSSTTDYAMLQVTKQIGRQPEIDSRIAWKIRGTGVTRQYVNSIEIDDVKFLVRSWLENNELKEFEKKIKEKIIEPKKNFQEFVGKLFKNYGEHINPPYIISQNVNKLTIQLDMQINQRRNIFPQLQYGNIKFTDSELSVLMPSCQQLIQSYIIPRKMDTYIFNIYGKQNEIILRCLNYYTLGIDEVDYQKLTEKVFVEIFKDENVLYPISELDKRIEIKTNKQGPYEVIKAAIEGESHLETQTLEIAPKYKKFKKTVLCSFISALKIEQNARTSNNNQIRMTKTEVPSALCFYLPISENIKAQEIEKKKIQKI